jgi:hypothetical protein
MQKNINKINGLACTTGGYSTPHPQIIPCKGDYWGVLGGKKTHGSSSSYYWGLMLVNSQC